MLAGDRRSAICDHAPESSAGARGVQPASGPVVSVTYVRVYGARRMNVRFLFIIPACPSAARRGW